MDWPGKDNEYIWHPFTQHGLSRPAIPIVKGKDALLWDVNGKAYIDAIASWWVNVWGHANEEIAAAISAQAAQLEQVIFAGFTHQPAVELAESLLSILPETQQKVFFSDNGSTSVEVALKMAIQCWHNQGQPRKTIVAFENAYHGDTFGAMSTGKSNFTRPFDAFLFEVIQIPVPTESNIRSVSEQFTKLVGGGQVAAFIFEPLVQGSGGMKMYSPVYLDELVQIAQSARVICIADEVMTGFGRTGKCFASDHLQNQPDIFCLSKGITGGFMPLGVTTCTQDIYNAFYSEDKMKTFFHGHSYTIRRSAAATGTLADGIYRHHQRSS
jgi:adenosylmethionine---8-amino-7-oxononanoate aminotransferase